MLVEIAGELLTQMLTSGYTLEGVTRVTEGLPPGAVLRRASYRYDVGDGPPTVILEFETEPQTPSTELARIHIQRDIEAHRLAHALALECTQEYVATASLIEQREDGHWHRLNAGSIESLAKDLRYLELRGKLTYHPEDHTLVRFIDDEEVPPCPT